MTTKTRLLAALMLFACTAKAQTTDSLTLNNNQTYQQVFDSLTGGLIKARVPYGVLYDRVVHWYTLTGTIKDTIDNYTLYQAWWDMEQSRVLPADSGKYSLMRQAASSAIMNKRIPVIAVDFNYALLDSNALKDGRLSKVNGIYYDDSLPQVPYTTGRLSVAGLPLTTVYTGDTMTVFFDTSGFSLSNTGDPIDSLVYNDLRDGTTLTILPGAGRPLAFIKEGVHFITVTAYRRSGLNSTATQAVSASTLSNIPFGTVPEGQFCAVEHHAFESDIPFQGYGEDHATTTWGDYHIYYHYNNSTGDCARTLLKPIIILDGYDPQDTRSFDKLYNGYLVYGPSNNPNYLGEDLRHLGYDVIILNFPQLGETISTDPGTSGLAIPRLIHKGTVGNLVDDNYYQTTLSNWGPGGLYGYFYPDNRDGGTDYIERNAFLLVKLIQKVDSALAANGSDEQPVVVGPSMGGQISRYALAYMEKQEAAGVPNMHHNTRLFVSFDSPNWGANIPLAVHQTLHFFGDQGGYQDAKDQYNQQIHTPAGRELLIEQLNWPAGSDPYRILYRSSLASNGLSGSGGYPMNLRKVALVNGSGNGAKNNTESQQFMGLEGYKAGIHVFGTDEFFLPPSGQTGELCNNRFTTYGWIYIDIFSQLVTTENINNNGCMDVVAGSTYAALDSIQYKFAQTAKNGSVSDLHYSNNLDYFTFIPTVSSLGFIKADFDWNTPVNNRDLVCTGEIPFDNYYIPPVNQPHITLTDDNVAWLKQELQKGVPGCNRVCGIYGPDVVCAGSDPTFTLDNPDNLPVSWTLNPNSQDCYIYSPNNTWAGVYTNQYISGSPVNYSISATVSNSCGADYTFTKIFSVSPTTAILPPIPAIETLYHNWDYTNIYWDFGTAPAGSAYEWSIDADYGHVADGVNGTATYHATTDGFVTWKVRNHTSCGYSDYRHGGWNIDQYGHLQTCYSCRMVSTAAENTLSISPNPSHSAWNFKFTNADRQPQTISITDAVGRTVSATTIANPDVTAVDCSQLPPGVYIATVRYSNGDVVTQKVVRE